MPVPMSISVLVSLMLLLSPLCCPLRSVPMSVLPPSLSPGSFTLFPVPCVLFSCLCAVPISVPGVPHAVPRPLRAVPMSLCCPHLCPRGPSRCSPSPPCCSRVSVLSPSLSPGSLTLFPVPSVLSPCLHTISPSIPISLTALQGTSVTGPGLGSHWGTLMAAPLCALTAPASLTPSLRSSGAPGGCSLPQGGAVAMPGHPGLPAVVTLAGPGTRATTGLAQGSSSPREGRAVPSLSPGTAAGTAAAAEDPSVQRVAMDHRAPGHWRSPCSAAVLAAALLLSCPSPARGQAPPFVIRQDPVAARAGGNVTFVLEPAPGRVLSCSWYRAPSTDLDSEIFTYYTEPDLGQQNGRAYTGRETGAANCSMCIRQLRLNDSGAYTVAVRQPASASASASLVVHELLTQPAVTPDNATVTENDTVTLSCRSPPGTKMVAWLRDGVPVAAGGRLSLSPDNRTLTVRPVQRGDAGAYVCQVSNAISTNRSDAATVTVVYGPDGVTVTPPGPLRLRLGSRLELLCAAAAAPPPLFAWARGNSSLATGSRLRLDFGDPGQAGEYRCRATNPALGRAAEASVLLLQEEGLGSGAIVGIVLGTLLGLLLLAAAGYLLWRRVGRSSAPTSLALNEAKPSTTPREAPTADGVDGTEEVKYSTLTFSTPGGPAPHRPPQLDGGTIYSEVRRK
ncbi:cell adhesion molecule CEACAM1-like isoform X3 [Athene noctua]|uniref:cell adhesion molecule CEACAM1-like isoform X3 n=1 Tax=Athene noctua TaxID=126797 RepID=UPI003EBADB10